MDHRAHRDEPSSQDQSGLTPKEARGGVKHWGLMLLCCVPMIATFFLIAFGIWN